MLNRIEYFHTCDFIHRDIKPDNFLIASHIRPPTSLGPTSPAGMSGVDDTTHTAPSSGETVPGYVGGGSAVDDTTHTAPSSGETVPGFVGGGSAVDDTTHTAPISGETVPAYVGGGLE